MDALIPSALRAMRSLLAPGMFGIFLLSIALTMAALTILVIAVSAFSIWLGGHLHGPLGEYMPFIGGIGAGILAWVLFPGIMPMVIGFFDGRIVRVIERADYPAAPPARMPQFWPELARDIRFALTVILLNILILPLYLLPLYLVLVPFYLLNGWLLGREFFVMVARRHMAPEDADMLRRRYARTVTMAGIALTMLATVPIINLLAPFWGIALMVHLYHRLANASPMPQQVPF